MRPGFAIVPDALEIRAAPQTERAVHRLFLLEIGAGGRHAQALAPAQAASGNHFASALGLHPIAKSVRTLTFQTFGLVYSLHKTTPLLEDNGGYYTLKVGS